MRGQEIWGAVLLCFGVPLWLWAYYGPLNYPQTPEGQELFFYRWGFTEYSLTGAIGLLGGLTGSTGVILLVTSLIGRNRAAWLRYSIGVLAVLAGLLPAAVMAVSMLVNLVMVASTSETFREVAPDGQTVIVRGGGFDPHATGIYTEYDQYHYQRQQTARFEHPEHVNAQDCHLDTLGDRLILTCGRETISVDPALTAEAN